MAIDLDALEAVLAKATPGEWEVEVELRTEVCRATGDELDTVNGYNIDSKYLQIVGCEGILAGPDGEANSAAIVALHNAAPALIAEHRALLARVEVLEGALRGITGIWKNSMHDDGENAAMMFEQARAALEPKL